MASLRHAQSLRLAWLQVAWRYVLSVRYWSGAVFLQALVEFGNQSSHKELATAPIALWGHSAGAQWSCSLANQHPERVMAFVANRGSDYYWRIRPELCRIPALWIAGEKDQFTDIIGHMADAYSSGADGRALGICGRAGSYPPAGNSKEFGIAFLDAIFRMRPARAATSPSPVTVHWTGSLRAHDRAHFDIRASHEPGRLASR